MAVKNYLRDLAAKRYNTEKQKAKRAVDFGRSAFSVAKNVAKGANNLVNPYTQQAKQANMQRSKLPKLSKTQARQELKNVMRGYDVNNVGTQYKRTFTPLEAIKQKSLKPLLDKNAIRGNVLAAISDPTNAYGAGVSKAIQKPLGNTLNKAMQSGVPQKAFNKLIDKGLPKVTSKADDIVKSLAKNKKTTKAIEKARGKLGTDVLKDKVYAGLKKRALEIEQQVPRNPQEFVQREKARQYYYGLLKSVKKGREPIADLQKTYQDLITTGHIDEIKNVSTKYKPLQEALYGKVPKNLPIKNENFAGAVAGFQQDENGNITYDPKAGLLGVAGVTAGRSKAGKKVGQGITKFGQRVVDDIGKGTAPLYNKVKDADIKNLVEGNLMMGKDSALKIARNTKLGAEANATAMGLMQDSLQKGDFDSFDLLLKEFSPRFSKQGQEISILRLWGKLTPTGAVKFADHLLNKLKIEGKLPKDHVFSNQAKQEIADLANRVQGLQSGTREHDIASALLMKRISEELPVNILRKISTGQTIAQLLNPKTLLRNIFGNAAYAGGELVSDVAAVPADILTSAITGQRSKTLPSLGAFGKGLVKGAKEGFQEARLGIDTKNLPSQFDMPQGYAFKSKVGRTLEKALSIGLRTFDRAFYEAAHAKSLANSMKVTGAKKPTLEMEEIAHYDALKATFQDESIPAIMFTKLKKDVLNVGKDWGLGDAVIKYPKTPGNILARALDYSPAGYAKAIMELAGPVFGKEFNQKAFVEALSRANVGSVGLVGVGAYLGKLGILTGEPNQDKDIRSLEAGQGAGQYRINASALKRLVLSWDTKQVQKKAGDTYISYDWLQPFAVPISMGVNAVQEEKKPYDQVAIDSLASGANTILEQPMVRGIQTLAGGYGDKLQGLRDVVQDIPASFTPGIINQVGQLTDNTKRSTYDPSYFQEATNKVMARFPLLREQLQPQYDVFGKPAEQYKDGGNNFWNVFLNPSFSSKFTDDPVAKEVLDIYHSTGEKKQAPRVAGKKIMIDGENYALPAESYAQYQKFIGEVTRWEFDKLMRDPTFNQLSDMEKANEMSRILTGIGQEARQELMKNGLAPMSMEEKAKSFLRAGDYSGYQEFVKQNPDINTMGDFKSLMSQLKTEMKPQEIIDIENKMNRQKKKIQGYPFVR